MLAEAFSYAFFTRALIAIVIICPILAMMGTMVVQKRMSFFSDALGHSAFTGVAIGVLLGATDLNVAMILFAALFAIVLNFLMKRNEAVTDTVISVLSSFCIAVGLAILSFGGSFAKYSSLLVGDVLSVTNKDIFLAGIVAIITLILWLFFANALLAISLNRTLASSRGVPVDIIDLCFSVLVAVVVMVCVKWIGVLLINALLILPSAAARNISDCMRQYALFACIFALFSGILGLFVSFFAGIAAGPAIIIFASVIYFATLIYMRSTK